VIVISKEFSKEWNIEDEPYYPVSNGKIIIYI